MTEDYKVVFVSELLNCLFSVMLWDYIHCFTEEKDSRSRSADEGQSTDTLSLNLPSGGQRVCVCVCVCVCVLPGNVSPVPLGVLQRNAVVETARSCRSGRLDRFRRQRCDKKTQRERKKTFKMFFSVLFLDWSRYDTLPLWGLSDNTTAICLGDGDIIDSRRVKRQVSLLVRYVLGSSLKLDKHQNTVWL